MPLRPFNAEGLFIQPSDLLVPGIGIGIGIGIAIGIETAYRADRGPAACPGSWSSQVHSEQSLTIQAAICGS
jgi:hypothetical protein